MTKVRTKYNVGKKKCERTFDDIVFDSVLEMKYYRDIILPKLENGELVHCEMQKKYVLQPAFNRKGKIVRPVEYKADFYTVDKNGKETVIDVKGCPDNVAKLKRKMFWYTYPDLEYIWIVFVKKHGGWIDYDECSRLRRKRKATKSIFGKKRMLKENKD